MERFRSDNDPKTTKPKPWVLRLGNYLMSNEPSEPMVLRLGNYLQKQPDGITHQHRRDGLQGGPQGADGAKPEQPPRREQPQDSPVEMNQNNHCGGTL